MSDFKIAQREHDAVQVLELKGYLDAHTAPALEEAFQTLLKNQRYNIVVNCKDLSYISSAGLGVFMAAAILPTFRGFTGQMLKWMEGLLAA